MANYAELVRAFLTKMRETPDLPLPPGAWEPVVGHRLVLLLEELGELGVGLRHGDLEEVMDATCDCIVVLLGIPAQLGVKPEVTDACFAEVCRSNLTKDYDPTNPKHGVKGPAYEPPRLGPIIRR